MRLRPILVAVLVAAAACDRAAPASGDLAAGRSAQLAIGPDDEVVAEVDGAPITLRRVEALVEETGRPAAEVVDRLIVLELLAAEARRRGLSGSRDARRAARQAMVQRFLEDDFEATRRPEDMPDGVLRRAFEQNIHRFRQPRRVKVAHVLVRADEKSASKAERAEAARLARSIHREARKAASLEEFLEVGRRHQGTSDLPVIVEELATPVTESARLVRPFIDASMALKRIGEVGPPVDTSFGTHVIYLVDERPAFDRPFEEVREEIRENEHPFWTKSEFVAMTDALRRRTKVVGYSGELRRDTDL